MPYLRHKTDDHNIEVCDREAGMKGTGEAQVGLLVELFDGMTEDEAHMLIYHPSLDLGDHFYESEFSNGDEATREFYGVERYVGLGTPLDELGKLFEAQSMLVDEYTRATSDGAQEMTFEEFDALPTSVRRHLFASTILIQYQRGSMGLLTAVANALADAVYRAAIDGGLGKQDEYA